MLENVDVTRLNDRERQWLAALSTEGSKLIVDNDEWYITVEGEEEDIVIAKGNGPYGKDLLFTLVKALGLHVENV